MVMEKTVNFVFPFQSPNHWKAIDVAEDHVTLHDISLEIVRYNMAVRKMAKVSFRLPRPEFFNVLHKM